MELIREDVLQVQDIGTDGYVRVVSAAGKSYRMSVMAFLAVAASAGAIAEEIGDLENLSTENKSSLVAAINEVESRTILYGTSSTTGTTRDKVVTCPEFDGTDGTLIAIKFSGKNSVTNARLNVNGTGAAFISSPLGSNTTWFNQSGTYLFRYNASTPKYELVGAMERTPTNDNPVMDGNATPGTSYEYARADHVHPKDTSKANTTTVGSLSNLTTESKENIVAAVNEVKGETTDLKGDLDDKLDAPATAGTNGQVLTSDGQGGQSWKTPSGGGGGGTSDYDDLENKPSINNVTLSGNKSASDLGLGTYSKPSGGIPKTDLASGVQTSLDRADTALQSYTETDPTVPSWAKAQSKPSYTASEVGAIAAPSNPSSGQFLVYNGSAWVAQTVPNANGEDF